jgi:hypothetical protein
MTEPGRELSAEEKRARGRRNVAIALTLAAFVVLVFVITLVRLKEQVAVDTMGGPS